MLVPLCLAPLVPSVTQPEPSHLTNAGLALKVSTAWRLHTRQSPVNPATIARRNQPSKLLAHRATTALLRLLYRSDALQVTTAPDIGLISTKSALMAPIALLTQQRRRHVLRVASVLVLRTTLTSMSAASLAATANTATFSRATANLVTLVTSASLEPQKLAQPGQKTSVRSVKRVTTV